MNLPDPKDINAYVHALMGPEFAAELRQAAAGIDRKRLRDATPLPWDSTHYEYEVISHDCA